MARLLRTVLPGFIKVPVLQCFPPTAFPLASLSCIVILSKRQAARLFISLFSCYFLPTRSPRITAAARPRHSFLASPASSASPAPKSTRQPGLCINPSHTTRLNRARAPASYALELNPVETKHLTQSSPAIMTNFPSIGLFPSGTTSPHAFSPFHQPPREMYTMYAALATGSSSASASTGRSRSSSSLTTSMWPKRSKSAKA